MPDISHDEWTVATLKESVDQRFAENDKAVQAALLGQEKAVGAAFLASEKAIIKAEILTDKRFDTVTNSVSELSDQTSNLMPRAEYVANHKALEDRVGVIDTAMNKTSGDKNLFVTTSELDAKLSSVVDRMDAAIKPVVDYVNQQKGQVSGSQLTAGKIMTILIASNIIFGIIMTVVSQITK